MSAAAMAMTITITITIKTELHWTLYENALYTSSSSNKKKEGKWYEELADGRDDT